MNSNTPHNQCPFCIPKHLIIETSLAYARHDEFPVSPGHALIITWRHISDWFETTNEERQALIELAHQVRDILQRERRPDGYNLGANVGEAAGQTIGHVHLHLIPRYKGDVSSPRGGVRGVIPARQSY
jgi:diadenosine tetraphosphate (Ap4A) HIT family hydrolase